MFNTGQFKKHLNTEWLGSNFIFEDVTDSTNSDLKKIPSDQLKHGTVLLADYQLHGRGQYNRNWISEPGQNLTFTLAFRPAAFDRLPLLTLATGWALIQSLNFHYQIKATLKLPNDILSSQKKIAGILTENIFYGSRLDRVLIGIGLNVNQCHFSSDIENATSVFNEIGKSCNRERLLAQLLSDIEIAYDRWSLGDPDFILEINRTLEGYGKWVEVTVNDIPEKDKVKLLGMNELGHLLILTKEFEVKEFIHEQVRIQPDYKKS
jgi:BirA family transcriptional regulator, biotin operon repressor / biotin---[acetyl-CoA-carboxylase] ligase